MRRTIRYPGFRVPGFIVPAGSKPEADQTINGAKKLRIWQGQAFKQLFKELLRLVVAPTGSGKSLVIAALAAQDLRDERAKKVVIAVSQSVIASSFDTSEAFVLPPRGPVVHWAPGHKLIETVNILDRLRT